MTETKSVGGGLLDSIRGKIRSAKDAASAKVEEAALKTVGLSSSALKPVSGFFKGIPATGRWLYEGLSFSPIATISQKLAAWIPIVLALLALVSYLLYKNGVFTPKTNTAKATEKVASPLNALAAKAAKAAKPATTKKNTEGFTVNDNFVSFQLPTISHTGLVSKTTFDVPTAVTNALMAGFRSFTLQIDYMESVKPGFPKIGEPALLYRGADGGLLSTNAGEIRDVATALAAAAFQTNVPNSMQPIIVYLHIVRAPSPIKEAVKYKAYLSKIAAALNPLAPVHLGMTPIGNFHRQNMEDTLLTTPISSLEGQVIVLCNADTSIFRSETGASTPSTDLDYWVNMRVYAEGDALGVAQPYSGSGAPAAVVRSFESIAALPTAESDAFAIKGKTRFVIALPKKNPSPTGLTNALNHLGVNLAPIDIFLEDTDTAIALVEPYSYESWHRKAAPLV